MIKTLVTGAFGFFTTESVQSMLGHRYIFYRKAKEELGYQPRSLFDTVSDSFQWFDGAGFLVSGASPLPVRTRVLNTVLQLLSLGFRKLELD